MNIMRGFPGLALSILIALAAGAIGSLFTYSEIPTWYAALVKPAISPPNWLFGPVWTTLYVLMGTAAWLVFRANGSSAAKRTALTVYGIQLILNALWSIIFFGMHALGVAFAELVALWIAIGTTIVLFARISRGAAWMLAPYIAWVSFAGSLNLMLWMLNR